MTDIYTIDRGKVTLHLHPGQTRAWDSEARAVFVVAGTQSGKTSFGPWWLEREIQRRGPGDYLAVTATYDLFKLKMLPEIRNVFERVLRQWTYQASDRVLYSNDTISVPGAPTVSQSRIILRSANAPGGLESATAQAAWLDECGQDEFKLDAWEAVQRRLSLSEGRILGTTTPYNLGWLKSEVYDRWAAGDPNFHVIQFTSLMNPMFPRAEYDRAAATLPPWKFSMFYRGEFSRPAGMIYDVFDDMHKIAPFALPAHWPRYGGLDFGGVHTASVGVAENPESKALYLYREYMQGGRTAAEHAKDLKAWAARLWVGGSASEGQWRLEFSHSGLPIVEPNITDVEVGILRVYGAFKRRELYVFDNLPHFLDEIGRYSRKLDDSGHPTEEIANKNDYHLMDATRYIVGYLRGDYTPMQDKQPERPSRWQPEPVTDDGRWRRY